MRYPFSFSTQYNQFYLLFDKTTDNGRHTNQGYEDKLDISAGEVAVYTQSYGQIKGELVLLEHPNDEIDFGKYDHIVEGGMDVKSGTIDIIDCPFSHVALSIQLTPQRYRIRVYSSGFASVLVSDDYEEYQDYYKIEIWPDENWERKVLKRYIET